jgi:uncharacterized membrane protein YbhN (UPF0104 family)
VRRTLARVTVSAASLWLVSLFIEVGDVLARLADLSAVWVALGLGISVLQVAVLAWRWRYTAARLGIDLPLKKAFSEYYLGILLNQLLPGGVTGDVSRAWRHARNDVPTGAAVKAVVLERATGQVVMTLVAAASVLLLPWAPGLVRLAVVGGVVAFLGLLARSAARRPRSESLAGRLWRDAQQAVLARAAFPIQLASALLVVGSYILVFLAAARAIGVDTALPRILPLVAPVLMTMLIPVTVAGWGIREGAAAALWGLAGLTPEDGAAISVTYGLVVLASSLPGLYPLTVGPLGGPGRRGRRPRA